ncbi:filamentous haemagglutinin family protein [Achromobacter insuavis]|uniref:filamentous haemagglutinin family protein n=1 Tax=Achromobacter insuavis TaxID=1287735 RepID=UPI000AFE1E17|nr:filamentous haemagglutinin family protein [Achromobacter insuavis]
MPSRNHALVSRSPQRRSRRPAWRLAPLTQALAVLLVAGGWSGTAQAQARAFSPGWFADKNAVQSTAQRTGRMPDGSLAGIGNTARQQAQSRQQLQRSLDNLNRTAAAVAAQQAAQAAARAAAAANGGGVPDGLAPGGLWIAEGAQAKWEGANKPTTGTEGGRQLVTIEQTQSRAILNWDTFNIGRNTTLQFKQGADDAVLNRVVGASARPSQIQGAIKADGTVLVVNQNGVIFSGTSQVNARNLVVAAATMSDAQFRERGIYANADGTIATFQDALGKIEVQPGARLATSTPGSATRGGGYVLLAGKEVLNAGEISTPQGQALLAAGDSFIIRRGQGSDSNVASTTRGNEVQAAGDGLARNTGLIQAPQGDITLAARRVEQAGVLVSTTSVDARGTIHLDARGTGAAVTLAESAVSAILVDASLTTALDGQRGSLLQPVVGGNTALVAGDEFRRDLSLLRISSQGTVDFQGGSLSLATGGQVAVKADGRALVRDGARIDVGGAVGVIVSMESNNLKINLQGNEQRDAPVNRDSKLLNNSEVWLDRRDLVRLAAGSGGNDADRWYTAGGLLEVGGYLGTLGVPVSHWLAQGGVVRFDGAEVVTQAGSAINLSGGTLDVQSGEIRQSWLRGEDGRLYLADRAPGDLLYSGLYRGYEAVSRRWGENATRRFYNPLIAPPTRYESGYTVGRDAGTLVISTRNAVLDGDLVSDTYQGDRQTRAPVAGQDGYSQSHRNAARAAQFVVGSYKPYYDTAGNFLRYQLGATGTAADVAVGKGLGQRSAGLELTDALPADLRGKLTLDADRLNGFGLGAIRLAAGRGISVDAALRSADGGEITLYAPTIDINADLVSRGGLIQAGNTLRQPGESGRLEEVTLPPANGAKAALRVAGGVVLDARGVWSNLKQDPAAQRGLAVIDGGRVSLRGTGDVALAAGSLIDVSSGAALLTSGAVQGGRGGSVTLEANAVSTQAESGGKVSLAGVVRGYGVNGGGALSIASGGTLVLGGPADGLPVNVVRLDPSLFQAGFASYDINGHGGLRVAEGANLDVAMPVWRMRRETGALPPTGADPAEALLLWTPPLYAEDPKRGKLTQRGGASLALRSDRATVGGVLEIGEGARVAVDPGQSIRLVGGDQITVLGRLVAPGGLISILDTRVDSQQNYTPKANGRSVWIGERAVLDVVGDSHVALATDGRRYGVARAGGNIEIGGMLDWEVDAFAPRRPMDRHLILRPGSLLDASGAQALVDLPGRGATLLAYNGGSIVLASANSLYLDGDLRAAAGGAGAVGGTLGVALSPAFYLRNLAEAEVLTPRVLTLAQRQAGSLLSADLRPGELGGNLRYGVGGLGVDQVQAGGFGNLALFASMRAESSLTLAMPQSLRLSGPLMLGQNAPAGSLVQLSAPYMFLNHAAYAPPLGSDSVVQVGVVTPQWLKRGHRLVLDAGMMDLRGMRDLLSFDDVQVNLTGDLRLTGVSMGQDFNGNTLLAAPNRLTITAAQIYPTTRGGGGIAAGEYYGQGGGGAVKNPDAVLTIRRATEGMPDMPYSAFGAVTLSGPNIIQGGVVRAPLGSILFMGPEGAPSSVRFLAGSVTSISGQGVVMPYGGTTDGIKYLYGGQEIRTTGVGGNDTNGAPSRMIQINMKSVVADAGSLLDLSGGGELTGAAFVRGRGGSVDVLKYAMADANPGFGFSKSGNAVYAIVPGFGGDYAPATKDAAMPAYGQRVTIGAGVPGLPPGTYTLLPANFAMLPGAFRVEAGAPGVFDAAQAAPTRGGSWVTTGRMTAPGVNPGAVPASQLLVTPGDVVRRHAQYNETSYNAFLVANAARTGTPLPMQLADAGMLRLKLTPGAGREGTPALSFGGEARFSAAPGSTGAGGTLAVDVRGGGLEILGPGQTPALAGPGVAVSADALNALRPARMVLGGAIGASTQADSLGAIGLSGDAQRVLVRGGASLYAPEIALFSPHNGNITIEQGAVLSTVGLGPAPQDARGGYYYSVQSNGALVLSNGLVNLRPPTQDGRVAIDIGACAGVCSGTTRLVSEGTLGAATNGAFTLRDNVEYGTRNLMLSVSGLNLGSPQALAQAAAAGQLPPGLALDQDALARLLRGNTALGAPALESLILNAAESINVYGAVTLDTRAAAGPSALRRLVLGAPAVYGYGAAGDTARISASEFVWAGSVRASTAGNVPLGYDQPAAPGGAVLDRLGDGSLTIAADVIRFDYSPYTVPASLVPANRLALGFAAVNLEAAQMITGVSTGSLHVYHKQNGYVAQEGWRYQGGDLTLRTPLLTGEAGATLALRAGGTLALTGTGAVAPARDVLGATLDLKAQRVTLDSTVALPSGKLTVKADGDITLGAGARIDLAGRAFTAFDTTRYSWGGDLELNSVTGNITQAAGSVIDLSARNQRGGRMQAVALGAAGGHMALDGVILGGASGEHDAGGTRVPYDGAEITLRAQTLADFAGLNQRLNEGGVTGARRFQLKQGNLVVGDEVRARVVEISVDGGSLTINGRIDASGRQVGSIRLAARDDLRINGLLDTHGARLRLDGYGKVIDAANRAIIELTSRDGTLALDAGARFDLRAGTDDPSRLGGRQLGTLDLNARRLGGGGERGAIAGSGDGANDVAIRITGTPQILGAKTVAVNAFRRYDDAPLAPKPDVSGKTPQLITQAYLDGIDGESVAYMNAALGNGALTARLAALGPYHLRPGVEIVSATPDGNLTVSGDIDLSNYRYGPNANRTVAALRGYGEPGKLVLRAGGDLAIHGSINDGFAPPPETIDDSGWKLVEGRFLDNGQTPFGEDLVVPIDGVQLETGTVFPAGRALNYDLPAQAATLPAGTVLPMAATLNGPLALPAGLVLTGDLTLADGRVLRAGSVLQEALTLGAGARLGVGFTLRNEAALQAFTWPKGVPLPAALKASARLELARGSLIPSQTFIELPGHQPINLRPVGPDGRQGRNWALAPMLGEGASAWSLMAVAGADLTAADMAARRPDGQGDIILADTHYGRLGFGTKTVTNVFIGDRGLTQLAIDELGLDQALLGTSPKAIAESFFMTEDDFCNGTGYCETASRTLTLEGSMMHFGDATHVGYSVRKLAQEWFMDESEVCFDASLCEGGGRTETTVTRDYRYADRAPLFSVLRTGTGDLSLLAGRDVGMASVYGVYTAGAPSSLGAALDARFNLPRGATVDDAVLGTVQYDGKYDAALAAYRAWYPDQGGNLTVAAGRDIYGDAWGANSMNAQRYGTLDVEYTKYPSAALSNWLWRQGSVGMPGVNDIASSWWINFGTYAANAPTSSQQPRVVGFTGFGTLGGGNLSISAGRDAGVRDARGDALLNNNLASGRSQALVAVVAGTGRVVGGDLVLTGGGDMDLRIGGAYNPNLRAMQQTDGSAGTGTGYAGNFEDVDLNGLLVNLRGQLALTAGRVGGISLFYGDGAQLRAPDMSAVGGGKPMGGPRLLLGDAVASLDTRGDLVLADAPDPGRVRQINTSPYVQGSLSKGGGAESWFTLWTPATAIDLFSAGGNLTPLTTNNTFKPGTDLQTDDTTRFGAQRQMSYLYPSKLGVTAAGGNIVLAATTREAENVNHVLLLAPSSGGALSMLAGGSIFAAGAHAVSMSGADTPLPTPWRPGFMAINAGENNDQTIFNVSVEGNKVWPNSPKPLFTFGPNTPLDASPREGGTGVARFHAVNGDIVGLRAGAETRIMTDTLQGRPRTVLTWYEAALPVSVRAGRDILGMSALGLHGNANDLSQVSAGRDIVQADLKVAGPGTLLVQAGRNIRQDDVASIVSVGAIVRGDARPGASVAVLAGVGPQGPDYAGLLARYLDPARALAAGQTLGANPDGVVQSYAGELSLAGWLRQVYGYQGDESGAAAELAQRQAQLDAEVAADPSRKRRDLMQDYRQESELHLVNWLRAHHSYDGGEDGARAALDALASEQQGIYARQLYFAELRKGGREYNEQDGPRSGSYLRGRRAIAALFPQTGAEGAQRLYQGDFTMYGGAGLRTQFGGDIQLLTPGGQQVLGIEGAAPPATAGVVTQGQGDIQLYALGSVLLGQSRIMTTFGGHIQAWSAEGDINAGRGAKTTVIYTPPKRVYDALGNVTLAPTAPSTGAGIATLAPIAEVPAGDVDLIAPLGTIDAGEAGIRVSGNVNVAALHVVNAANIQVQGDSKGIPVTAVVNTGALSSASAASSAASGAAEDSVQRARQQSRQNQPSVINVQILGYGEEPMAGAGATPQPRAAAPSYRPDGVVQVQGVDSGG